MTKLDDLDARLKNAKARYEKENAPRPSAYSKEMNLGMRAFMEMVGVLLGSGLMGWVLDDYFGTTPIILIIFVILGVAAAFFNLYKLSRNLGTAIASNSLQSETKPDKKPSQSETD
ncbi:MAG TPA: AtpZ/AtpI family protein [Micavibrio sp.]|nr:AtpZ/AtpI family protein [Micavibrio sp.]